MNAKGPGQNGAAAGQGNGLAAPSEAAPASRPVAVSGPAKEMIDKYGPAIVARYPELIGKFKVPGRKPGRPHGSKASSPLCPRPRTARQSRSQQHATNVNQLTLKPCSLLEIDICQVG